jgi:hypothetical protein
MHGHRGHHLLRRQLSTLVRLAQTVAENPAAGVPAYKPPNSDAVADHYIFDYLGMIGIPLIPVSEFPSHARTIFLPTQAAADDRLVEQIKETVSQGNRVICTAGLLQALAKERELLRLAGVAAPQPGSAVTVSRLLSPDETAEHAIPLELPAQLQTTTARALLSAKDGDELFPFLTVNSLPAGGKLFVLNAATYSEKDFKAIREVLLAPKPVPWIDLPPDWLNIIRTAFVAPLQFEIRGPGLFSVHALGTDDWVICNFADRPADITIAPPAIDASEGERVFKNKIFGERIEPEDGQLRIRAAPRRTVWITATPRP